MSEHYIWLIEVLHIDQWVADIEFGVFECEADAEAEIASISDRDNVRVSRYSRVQ